MCRRAAVLGELGSTKQAYITSALHPFIMHVSRKALVPIHCQAFFQRQLEPVAASDPVASPVMEIFMRNDRFHAIEVFIRCCLRISKNKLAVKDIQALIFHRAHVEMADGDNLEEIQIIFQAIGVLVPLHRPFQRIHRMTGQADITLLDIDMKIDLAS